MEQLLKAYRERRLILFVGAGVSMGLGLPSWSQLIDQMAKDLDYDPAIFKSYGSDLALAEFYRINRRGIGQLRSWMDCAWHPASADISTSRVHKLIAELDIDLVYTTNYDRWLEKAFDHHGKLYTKVVGVDDMAAICKDKRQIIKFHGDFDDDSSIVLDETSYFERMEFESPLDIKLRADVMGRSVLFIGYSFSDFNIRYLFYRLAHLWKASSRGGTQPMSFLFSNRPNPIQEAVLAQWHIQMLSSNTDEPGAALIEILETLASTK